MEILSIKRIKSKYEITFLIQEEKVKYMVYEDTIMDSHFLTRKKISESEYALFLEKKEFYDAYYQAQRYCDSMKSKKEVRLYLRKKNVREEFIESIIQKLEALHYIDEDSYTKMMIDHYIRTGYGKNYIVHKMMEKGISMSLILDKLSNIENSIYENSIRSFLEKKIQNPPKNKTKNQCISSWRSTLLSRGFEDSQIQKIIYEMSESLQVEEDTLIEKEYLKAKKKYPTDTQKIFMYLYRKGFSISKIKAAMKDVNEAC